MDVIRHRGVVSGINPGSLKVTIVSESACAACHAKGFCNPSDQKETVVDVVTDGQDFSMGQSVMLIMRASSGIKALFLGYILPFLILLSGLVIFIYFTKDEILSGLLSLALLIPYYFILYRFRDHLKTTFRFELED